MVRIMAIMARRRPYTSAYMEAIEDPLRAIDSKHHPLIHQKIEEQLLFEPATATRNRKPLRQPTILGATWEIRFGPDNRFRVLYDILEESRIVRILAVPEKFRERLFIGGEEVSL
jgi:hypothetical protein